MREGGGGIRGAAKTGGVAGGGLCAKAPQRGDGYPRMASERLANAQWKLLRRVAAGQPCAWGPRVLRPKELKGQQRGGWEGGTT